MLYLRYQIWTDVWAEYFIDLHFNERRWRDINEAVDLPQKRRPIRRYRKRRSGQFELKCRTPHVQRKIWNF
jgi:hypothetical protein